ncbi:hypothetical protein [Streptomyces macrosporus]|uniref:Uncharacterized protein n=1 Tax=Streptomyces macrosporus TaxID=44032 RepID=A0ABN3JFT1_9ACTN
MTTVPGGRDPILSALVVLRPTGEGPALDHLIADRVHRFLPSPDVVRTVAAWFASRGFDVDEAVGISFALTGPRSLFQETFRLRGGDPRQEAPLGLDALPREVARHISAVTFTAPPDFGPGNP